MSFDNVLRHAYNNSITFFDLSSLGELYTLLPDDSSKQEEVNRAVEDFDIDRAARRVKNLLMQTCKKI